MRTLEPLREVVDGQQRLRTLLGFIDPKCLPDYKHERDWFVVSPSHNEKVANKEFTDLGGNRERMLEYEFSVQVLPPGTGDAEVLEIFARLNSTGVKLNAQELRNAKFFGEFKKASYKLAYEQLGRWRAWGLFEENDIARMLEVEMVSELIQLVFYGARGKSQRALDNLYRDKDRDEFPERAEVAKRFDIVMDAIDDVLGRGLNSMQFSKITLFYTLFSYIYDVLYSLGSPLDTRNPGKLPPTLRTCLVEANRLLEKAQFPEDVDKALRGRTTHAGSRKIRLDFLRSVCEGDAT